jgi:hypothetical protein
MSLLLCIKSLILDGSTGSVLSILVLSFMNEHMARFRPATVVKGILISNFVSSSSVFMNTSDLSKKI